MIESPPGWTTWRKSPRLPGLDVLFIGPYDLSLSLESWSSLTDPIFWNAVDRVGAACKAAGIAAGIQRQDADALEAAPARVGFLMYSSDVAFFFPVTSRR